MDRAGLIVRGTLQHTAHHRRGGEAHRVEELRAEYATGTAGMAMAAVLVMEKEMAHS